MAASYSLPHFDVVEFHQDLLVNFIRSKTGWESRDEIDGKAQLAVLIALLKDNSCGNPAQTMVFEEEYADKQYAEDYAQYFARALHGYPKLCSRVHFFRNDFSKFQFVSALESGGADPLLQQMQESYIGFLVIRPIPRTFIAKLCLNFADLEDVHLIKSSTEVSLFGLSLNVDSVPFTEQDRIVAACASAAIWSYLAATPGLGKKAAPSLSGITSAATLNSHKAIRTFPAQGLSADHIVSAFQRFNLEPVWLHDNINDEFEKFKESQYSYLKNNIPVLMGVKVYERTSIGGFSLKGLHCVCVVGFRKKAGQLYIDSKASASVVGENLNRLYVHDDRYGPYQELDLENLVDLGNGEKAIPLVTRLDKSENVDQSGGKQFFVPQTCLIAVDHKIRIPYSEIRNHCLAFGAFITNFLAYERSIANHLTGEQNSFLRDAEKLLDPIWDIYLTPSNALKEELLASQNVRTFNSALPKSALLSTNFPKHVWRCRLISRDHFAIDTVMTDLLFDASDIPQGKLFLGYVCFNDSAIKAWKLLETKAATINWHDFVDLDAFPYISCVRNFVSRDEKPSLFTALFGRPQLPHRSLKLGEGDQYGNVKSRRVLTIRFGSNDAEQILGLLETTKEYIWLVTKRGDLIVGEDVVSDDSSLGHVTLIDGKMARLGGMILYSENRWTLNLRSRAYTPDGYKALKLSDNNYVHASPNAAGYLERVCKYFFKDTDLAVSYDQIGNTPEKIKNG
jgi:hypothetical protein